MKRNFRPFYSKKSIKPKIHEQSYSKPTDDFCEQVRDIAYLGKKGYTIPKSILTKEETDFLKEDLIMRPYVFGATGPIESFPVYRENTAKIYLPRFYGIARYGIPKKSELQEGDDIAVDFIAPLRDYQDKIINIYMTHVSSNHSDSLVNNSGGGAILEVPCGRGKCLAKDTLVMMYDNSTKKVQDIIVGDLLMGDDQYPRTVSTLARGREIMYKIKEKGLSTWSYTVNYSHILSLKVKTTSKVIDISLSDYLRLDKEFKQTLIGYRIPNRHFPIEYEIEVEPIGEGDYYGFEIDGNRRFVLGEYTVTHNTVMALKIMTLIKKKTLILVHKEFLMNQWIERATQFIPQAKIGKIQGQVFDIEGKDVVIGMIQTMYSREFPAGTFDSFGLTIIDEVHRIGSEEFSKTLLKTVTPYMLGISATVERKDKLTKILYMFIGPKIYEEDREDEDPVVVRGIEYMTRDEGFAETEYDFRGNPKFSTMISKLCDYGPRSDFIVRVISDLIQENPQNQIMVLAHNRSLLKYLYDAINHKNIATAGYYLGGMKEADLKETEGKQIVIATYAMAAEALDIKSLSTLVMATPKTDIEQSVGRILRERHKNPIVVDIVDMHDLFKNQWRTRKTFYRKCNYKVMYIPSTKYQGFLCEGGDWKVEFEPRKKGAVEVIPKPIGKCLIKIEE
jgi:hypothetical protein